MSLKTLQKKLREESRKISPVERVEQYQMGLITWDEMQAKLRIDHGMQMTQVSANGMHRLLSVK